MPIFRMNGMAKPSFALNRLQDMDETEDLVEQEYDIQSTAASIYFGQWVLLFSKFALTRIIYCRWNRNREFFILARLQCLRRT